MSIATLETRSPAHVFSLVEHRAKGPITLAHKGDFGGYTAGKASMPRLHRDLRFSAIEIGEKAETGCWDAAHEDPSAGRAVRYTTNPSALGGNKNVRHILTVTQAHQLRQPGLGVAQARSRQGVSYLSDGFESLTKHQEWSASWREMEIPLAHLQSAEWQDLGRAAIEALIASAHDMAGDNFASTEMLRDRSNATTLLPGFEFLLACRFCLTAWERAYDDYPRRLAQTVLNSQRRFAVLWLGRDRSGSLMAMRAYVTEIQKELAFGVGILTENPALTAEWPNQELQTLQEAILPGN
jgi:hypothetical protein